MATKVDWYCPNCGAIAKAKSINKVVSRSHIPCAVCGKDVSRPEKIALCAIKQAGIEVETQKTFSWSGRKRYDFYLPDLNTIIEVNGAQHYGFGFENLSGFSLDDQIRVDAEKKAAALNNGISHYFVIFAADVPAQQIVVGISVALASIGVIVPINVGLCERAAMTNAVSDAARLWNSGLAVAEIEKAIGLSRGIVIRHLKRASEIGLCHYCGDEAVNRGRLYQNNSSTDHRKKAVRCTTTGAVFKSMAEAVRAYGVYSIANIRRACESPSRHAGELNGQKLAWEYV